MTAPNSSGLTTPIRLSVRSNEVTIAVSLPGGGQLFCRIGVWLGGGDRFAESGCGQEISSHVHFLHLTGVAGEKLPPLLGIALLHEGGDEAGGYGRVLERDALELALGRVEGRVAQLLGVHLAEAFVAPEVQPLC